MLFDCSNLHILKVILSDFQCLRWLHMTFSGIIVLAVFLGLCVLIIIGLIINTTRIRRKLRQISDIENVELDDNYEGLQVCKMICS